MIGKQIINNAQEILVPKLKAWWQKKQVKLSKKHKTRWEEDYQLIDSEGLFQEYLEMGESCFHGTFFTNVVILIFKIRLPDLLPEIQGQMSVSQSSSSIALQPGSSLGFHKESPPLVSISGHNPPIFNFKFLNITHNTIHPM